MLTFHIYVNRSVPGTLARVHLSHCVYCNDGHGIHPRALRRASHWYGPFATFAQAYDAARQFARYRTKCQHCRPHRLTDGKPLPSEF
ncbi:MAG: hypothetical protein HY868_19525 [Chloroflexi bacterium]|nr:hypothetical protein [Chloroflexota bacterium]